MNRVIGAALFSVAGASAAHAQWAVIDVANLSQSVTNYAALIEQISKQAQQISNQVQQIRQMEDQLHRIGNMSDFRALVGFPEFRIDLSLPTKIKTWGASLDAVDGSRIFGDTRSGIFPALSGDFRDFNGDSVSRDADAYRPVVEMTNKVDNFRDVQADVYARRENLKQAITKTSEALQAAETVAEEQKLEAVLKAEYDELAATDSEVMLSAAEIQVKTAEANAMETAQDKADAESRRKLVQQEAAKLKTTFTPQYECFLQYVSETPFSP
jgi:conjugal transfer/entry exclusion protein